MPREKEGFREQLAALMERYPGREVIDIKEAAEMLNVCVRTLREDQSFPSIKIGSKRGNGPVRVSLVQLARWMT
jgi:hypothetical protein